MHACVLACLSEYIWNSLWGVCLFKAAECRLGFPITHLWLGRTWHWSHGGLSIFFSFCYEYWSISNVSFLSSDRSTDDIFCLYFRVLCWLPATDWEVLIKEVRKNNWWVPLKKHLTCKNQMWLYPLYVVVWGQEVSFIPEVLWFNEQIQFLFQSDVKNIQWCGSYHVGSLTLIIRYTVCVI